MGESESKNDRSSLVMLKPFIHQVGGHSSIQQFDQYTVCKPLFSKELRFYQEVGATFKPFIPEFKGVVNVRDVKESKNSRFQVASSHNHIKLHTYRYGKHCSTCSCQRDEHRSKKRKKRTESENSSSEEEAVSNSSTLNRDSPHFDDSSLEYILLENVVGHYKYPCILDLKMGTEKHKDYVVSKEEADRRQARWDQTTSRSLGVRVCGMKVYLVNKSGFSVMSGGRDLTVEGFRNAIKTFLHNGERSRHEVIELFLKQLDKLLNIMEKQSSYRFYNTSLLLIYEGDDCSVMDDCSEHVASNCEDSERARPEEDENSRVKVGVRMIDFAHVHHNSQNGKSEVSQHVPDESYLFGLRSVIRILKETLAELRPE